ncbi:hypothetical protein AAFF_G00375320 [Aldrovandia affinis]|uniref:Insulin-like domain-containing protein n=1 Tax=Aldrovandia affinis TaxID=143900 RepID=A0AAD7WLY9_9TELE|nr:hypothetical protein AAFF_G00375320 [Aldrovandia affinis]
MLRFLAVTVMFVSIVAECAGTEGEGKAVLTRDYGVKLCGREFIRAVIFTCGGSRWRRTGEVDSLQSSDRNPFLINSYSDLSESSNRLNWLQSRLAATEHPQKPTSSLVDLLKVLGDVSDYESGAEWDQGETPQWESAWRQGLPMKLGANPQIPWPRSNRQKRNFSLGLAGMCCNQGCTKNDIGRLC